MYVIAMVFILAGHNIISLADHNKYLGPRLSKKYFFPWTVTFHHIAPSTKEFFATGSLLTDKYVLTSMDSWIRRSRGGRNEPFYLHTEEILVVAGSIWSIEYEDAMTLPSWMELRNVEEIRMFSTPGVEYNVVFNSRAVPSEINLIKRTPYGFVQTLGLVTLKPFEAGGSIGFAYKRNILPIPLHIGDGRSAAVGDILRKHLESFEAKPFGLQCYVGGWRRYDGRLVNFEVVYVPFEDCSSIYCDNDPETCFQWPVNGTHVCFKSSSFLDVCWRDQGSSLYCEQLSDSVIAVLTTAPSCGRDGLPGVYTLIHHGLELLENFHPQNDWYKAISAEDLRTKYAAPNDEQSLIPADMS